MAESIREHDIVVVGPSIIANITTEESIEDAFLSNRSTPPSPTTEDVWMGKERGVFSKEIIRDEWRPRLLSSSRMERVAKQDLSHSDIKHNEEG